MQQTGIVKWFNNAKGYGFIIPDESGGDIFAHYSSIAMEGYKTLKAGQLVAFDTIPGPKGLHASGIRTLDKLPASGSDTDKAAGEAGTDGNSAASAERSTTTDEASSENTR